MAPQVDFERDVHCVMGLPFDAVTLDDAVRIVCKAVRNRTPLLVSTPNLNFLATARGNSEFRHSVLRSELLLADGMPIVWISRLLGVPIRERSSGAGLFDALALRSGPPIGVFFFGGAEGVARTAHQRMNERCSGLRCVGYESPGFGSLDELSTSDVLDRINRANPDFIVVALGAQKGQSWIVRNRSRLRAPVISHLGAVLNFVAGTIHRAPIWVQRSGFEWIWRIKEEPMLLHRYSRDGRWFARAFLKEVLPRWWQVHREISEKIELPCVEVTKTTEGLTMTSSGCCTGAGLGRLRSALSMAADACTSVCLDLSREIRIDARAAALLLLFQAYQTEIGKQFVISGANQHLRFQFASQGIGWLVKS